MVFILGAIVGIVLMLIVFAPKLLSGSGKARGGILMLERPGDRFDARSFKVFHVIKEGALANAAENDGSDGVMYSGTTVLFPAGGVNSFYDEQIITVPEGKIAMQVGTLRDKAEKGDERTFPVVDFLDENALP